MDSAFWTRDHICSRLDGMEVDVCCGLHPWERHPERPNRLRISVALYAPVRGARLADQPFLDYDHVGKAVRALAGRPHVELLETLVDEITARCFDLETVAAVRVRIEKPDIFNDASSAGIETFRTRDGFFSGTGSPGDA